MSPFRQARFTYPMLSKSLAFSCAPSFSHLLEFDSCSSYDKNSVRTHCCHRRPASLPHST
jgi:hypothetical protein